MDGNNDILEKAYDRAVEVLSMCSTKNGFFASAGKEGYDAVWSRDSMITSLGGSLVEDKFKKVFAASIVTLGKNQSKNGQIPNAIDKFANRKHHVDFKSIDSSLWYLIGHYIYAMRYKDKSLLNKHKRNINEALDWLACQDTGEVGVLAQLPTSDWQDAFPHKYGYTINTQALYFEVLCLIGKKKEAENLKRLINKDQDDKLWNGQFYVPYRWKNHGKYKEIGDWFDSLGNLLAVVFGLADRSQAEKILSYIKKKKINQPYPVRTIYPPITRKSKGWHDYFLDCDAGKPNNYSNGGIWGFQGGFYVLALIKLKKYKEAELELKKLAEIELRGDFPEWIHPKTKECYGKLQAWEAGMYILAYESFKKKKCLI